MKARIAFASGKGGTGKTTFAVNSEFYFFFRERRSSVIAMWMLPISFWSWEQKFLKKKIS